MKHARRMCVFFVVIALALVSFFVRAGEEGEHSEHTNPHAYTAVLVFHWGEEKNHQWGVTRGNTVDDGGLCVCVCVCVCKWVFSCCSI